MRSIAPQDSNFDQSWSFSIVRGIATSEFGLEIEFYLLAIFYTENVNRPYIILK